MKELLEAINNYNEEETKLLIDDCINFYTKAASDINIECDTIGTDVGINPRNYSNDEYDYGLNIWRGYIPKNTRIVYGVYGYPDYKSANHGCYYYLDDESYIYDFIKYIKDRDIEDTYDFIISVNKFLKLYLDKAVNSKTREEIHKLLYKDELDFYEPVNEHSIKDFKNTGAGQCTEYTALAENIFSIFDFDIYYMMDVEHAYNLLIDNDKTYILDFANWVPCYDINLKYLGRLPYFVEIPDFTDELFDKVKHGSERIELPDYYFLAMNDDLIEVRNGDTREYGVDAVELDKNAIIK